MSSYLEAVLLSDIHISHKFPIARSEEPNWYDAQLRVMNQIKKIANGALIICGGDVFHDGKTPSKCPPEMINWCIDNFPPILSVAGNHDLPSHRLEEIEKSPFWTLVKAGKICQLGMNINVGRQFNAFGANWGETLPKIRKHIRSNLGVVHRYIWIKGTNFPDAPKENHADSYAEELEGYDCSLWGDNHTTFIYRLPNGHTIFNPGSLMRRNSDQWDHRPCVGKLYSDGRIEVEYLDISQDKLSRKEERLVANLDNEVGKEFLDELFGLAENGIDFPEVVCQWIIKNPNLPKRTREMLIKLVDK